MSTRLFLQRLFVVLLCLSVLFSSTLCASASTDDVLFSDENFGQDLMTYEELDTSGGQYKVRWVSQYGSYVDGEFIVEKDLYGYTGSSGSLNVTNTTTIRSSSSAVNPMTKYIREQFVISTVGDVKLGSQGSSLQVTLDNIKMSMFATNSNGDIVRYSYFNPDKIAQVRLIAYDKSGQGHVIDKKDTNFNVTANGLNVSFGADFDNLPCDVYKVNVVIMYYGSSAFDNNNGDSSASGTTWNWANIVKGWGFDNSTLVIKSDNNVSGLLSSIIGFIQSILDGVRNIFTKIGDFMTSVANNFTSLFSKLGNWFGDLIDSIIELPKNIWEWIENGLKALFIPSVDYMDEYQGKYSDLFKDRFGLLYECVVISDEFFGSLEVSTKQNYIDIPSVTVDLAGEDFTFGGYQMQIVPNKFEFLATAVKTLTSIICTFGFILAMKNRFNRLLERG